jgi:hypothetical protein
VAAPQRRSIIEIRSVRRNPGRVQRRRIIEARGEEASVDHSALRNQYFNVDRRAMVV